MRYSVGGRDRLETLSSDLRRESAAIRCPPRRRCREHGHRVTGAVLHRRKPRRPATQTRCSTCGSRCTPAASSRAGGCSRRSRPHRLLRGALEAILPGRSTVKRWQITIAWSRRRQWSAYAEAAERRIVAQPFAGRGPAALTGQINRVAFDDSLPGASRSAQNRQPLAPWSTRARELRGRDGRLGHPAGDAALATRGVPRPRPRRRHDVADWRRRVRGEPPGRRRRRRLCLRRRLPAPSRGPSGLAARLTMRTTVWTSRGSGDRSPETLIAPPMVPSTTPGRSGATARDR